MVESFRGLRKCCDRQSLSVLLNESLFNHEAHPSTELRAPGTKGSDDHDFKLRDLRAFVVKSVFTFWLRLRRAGSLW
jgi:hypothetical protein